MWRPSPKTHHNSHAGGGQFSLYFGKCGPILQGRPINWNQNSHAGGSFLFDVVKAGTHPTEKAYQLKPNGSHVQGKCLLIVLKRGPILQRMLTSWNQNSHGAILFLLFLNSFNSIRRGDQSPNSINECFSSYSLCRTRAAVSNVDPLSQCLRRRLDCSGSIPPTCNRLTCGRECRVGRTCIR